MLTTIFRPDGSFLCRIACHANVIKIHLVVISACYFFNHENRSANAHCVFRTPHETWG
jgi:hypothetical protein